MFKTLGNKGSEFSVCSNLELPLCCGMDSVSVLTASTNAARQGFEPQFLVPETNVLPLDDRAIVPGHHTFNY